MATISRLMLYSGAVHLLDKPAYDLLGELDGKMAPRPDEHLFAQFADRYDRQSIEDAYQDLYAAV